VLLRSILNYPIIIKIICIKSYFLIDLLKYVVKFICNLLVISNYFLWIIWEIINILLL